MIVKIRRRALKLFSFCLIAFFSCKTAAAGPPDWEILTQDLKSPAASDRTAAIRAMASLGQARACPLLCPLLTNDSDPSVRWEVAKSLRYVPGTDAIAALADGLEDEDLRVRRAVVESLRLRPETATVQYLSKAMTDPKPEIRLAAVLALGTKLPPEQADALSPALQDSSPRIRDAAIYALGATGGDKAVALLAGLLSGDLPSKSKALAAEMLGAMGSRRDLPELIAALPDADKSTVRPAIDAAILKIIARQDARDQKDSPPKKEPVKLPEPERTEAPAPAATDKSASTSVEFKYKDAAAAEVLLAGSFLHGKPQKMNRAKNGTWSLTFSLAPGQYRYLFVVDGRRVSDPNNPNQIRGVSIVNIVK